MPKVKNDANAPLCDWCKKKEAEFECERCESETGDQPYRFFCGRHIQKIKNHEDPSKHNYKKICELSDSGVVELMHTSNIQKSLITGQLSQLNSELEVTVEAIEGHFQSVIDGFIEEMNLQKEKTLREIEAEISKKRNDLNSQMSSTERLLDKLKILSEHNTSEKSENDNSEEKEELISSTKAQIEIEAKEIDKFQFSAGPNFVMQPFDENIKRLARQVFDYEILSEPIDFNKLKEYARKTRPIVTGSAFKFSAPRDLPIWCLRDCPVIMLPHPDLKTNGRWARKLVELQCTAAVESNLVQRARRIHQIHGCALLKCEDGISRRVMLRRIDDKFENMEDEEEMKSDRNVIELSGPELSRHQSGQKELIKLENIIEKHVELHEYTGKHKEMLTFPVRGTYTRDTSNSVTCKYDMKLKNKLSMLLAIQILKDLTEKGKELETLSWAVRAQYFLFYVDETDMAPIPIDLNAPEPLKDLKLYEILDELDVESLPPLAIECWINLNYINDRDVMNCEPFSSKFQNPEVSFALRNFLEDANEFKVEFMARIGGTDAANAWLTNITANKENIADKIKSYLDIRTHFTVPRKNS